MKRIIGARLAVLLICAAATLYSQQAAQQPPTQQPPAQTAAPQPAPQAAQPAQTAAPAAQETAPAPRRLKRFAIGARVRVFPARSLSAMQNGTLLTTTPTPAPVKDWNFVTTSHSSPLGYGGAIEFVPAERWTVSIEGMRNKVSYTKVTTIAWGGDDPATSNDERSHIFRNESSSSVLWDIPVLLHRQGIGSGKFRRVTFAIGPTLRNVSSVRSTTVITNTDASTNTNNSVVPPSKRNVIGGTVGLGFRIIDDFNIRWTPEIRYTRWTASTYALDSTVSPRNQLEISFGFTF